MNASYCVACIFLKQLKYFKCRNYLSNNLHPWLVSVASIHQVSNLFVFYYTEKNNNQVYVTHTYCIYQG